MYRKQNKKKNKKQYENKNSNERKRTKILFHTYRKAAKGITPNDE